ncbi:MAG: hypothetical protein MUE52_09630 [Tabrizicola sp.]|jgi:hypothetical protein|nr:hypothetical protein [Tabrizicola sp.]
MIRTAALLTLLSGPALADPTLPAALQTLLKHHASACQAQGGTLTQPDGAIMQAFLFGPEDPALILDSRKLSCSTGPRMFCGDEIGCEVNVFVGEAQHSLVALDWSLVPDGDRQLLQVTIAGELLNQPKPGTFRMTWDRATASLATVD